MQGRSRGHPLVTTETGNTTCASDRMDAAQRIDHADAVIVLIRDVDVPRSIDGHRIRLVQLRQGGVVSIT